MQCFVHLRSLYLANSEFSAHSKVAQPAKKRKQASAHSVWSKVRRVEYGN